MNRKKIVYFFEKNGAEKITLKNKLKQIDVIRYLERKNGYENHQNNLKETNEHLKKKVSIFYKDFKLSSLKNFDFKTDENESNLT